MHQSLAMRQPVKDVFEVRGLHLAILEGECGAGTAPEI
jgi:hypothetical protein